MRSRMVSLVLLGSVYATLGLPVRAAETAEDEAGSVVVVDERDRVVAYEYDDQQRVILEIRGDGTEIRYGYDADGKQITLPEPDSD